MLNPEPSALEWSALMYVAAAVAPDGFLSDGETQRIGDLLKRRFPDAVHTEHALGLIGDALQRLPVGEEAQLKIIDDAATALAHSLSAREREGVLRDLVSIARADGVVMRQERDFIEHLARRWKLDPPDSSQPLGALESGASDWSALHDLTLIYLVLAHGTDNDLSKNEVQVMIRKLKEWQPDVSEDRVRAILRTAMNRYAEGVDERRLHQAILAVKESMPASKRMAALHDLIQIANADGVFLDVEEDLINSLLAEWEVDPYANYGRHGEKE